MSETPASAWSRVAPILESEPSRGYHASPSLGDGDSALAAAATGLEGNDRALQGGVGSTIVCEAKYVRPG
jgi:hypothetical protein